MKLKDKLILRNIAGRYIIVPVGQRTKEVRHTVCISGSAAYLWDFMKQGDFTVEALTDITMGRYTGVTREQAQGDIEHFIEVLKSNYMLEPEPGEMAPVFGSLKVEARETVQQ